MGYTHYWYRPVEIDAPTMEKIATDFRTLLPEFERLGVPLAGGLGDGDPMVTTDGLWFNGRTNCGHASGYGLVILVSPWPTEKAGGVATAIEAKTGKHWIAGDMINARACDGDCSYETFDFPRKMEPNEWAKPNDEGLYFEFCKTAFRPYDLAVCCALLIAKHYMGGRLKVSTDGTAANWADARVLCQVALGYGAAVPVDY